MFKLFNTEGTLQCYILKYSSGETSAEDVPCAAIQNAPLKRRWSPLYKPGKMVAPFIWASDVLLAKGFGYADLEKKIPADPQTSIGSGP
jgi:CubicO group peptidase (beta-lactamase class C family)